MLFKLYLNYNLFAINMCIFILHSIKPVCTYVKMSNEGNDARQDDDQGNPGLHLFYYYFVTTTTISDTFCSLDHCDIFSYFNWNIDSSLCTRLAFILEYIGQLYLNKGILLCFLHDRRYA